MHSYIIILEMRFKKRSSLRITSKFLITKERVVFMPNGAKLKTREEIKKLIEELSKNIEKETEKQFGIFKKSSDDEYNQLKKHFDDFFTELEGMWNSATTTGPLKNPQGVQKLDFFICKICNPKESEDKIRGIFNNAREKLNTAEDRILDCISDYRKKIRDLLSECVFEFQGKIDDDKKLAEAEIKIDKVSKPIKFGEIASECMSELIEDYKTNIVNAFSEEVGRDRIIDQLRKKKVIEG